MPNALKLVCACLTVTLASACSGLKPFPTDRLWEYSPADGVCAEYQITDTDKMRFKHLRDVPEKDCPAIFGFLAKDIPKVTAWARDAQKYAKERCK